MKKSVLSRRDCLKNIAMWGSFGAITIITAVPVRALASSGPSMTKPEAEYVYHAGPDGDHCAECRHFIPNPAGPGKNGKCHFVEGAIDPNGYCDYFDMK